MTHAATRGGYVNPASESWRRGSCPCSADCSASSERQRSDVLRRSSPAVTGLCGWLDTSGVAADTAVMDRDDTGRIEDLRTKALVALAHLEEVQGLDDVDLPRDYWDTAESRYFGALDELDSALQRLGLERREDLGSNDWHQPLSDHARAASADFSWDEGERGQGLER